MDRHLLIAVAASAAIFSACPLPQPTGDAGPDAGPADGGEVDAGAPDAGGDDAGAPDAGAPDAGAPDAGAPDAGGDDAGTTDGGGPGDGGALFECPAGATCVTETEPNDDGDVSAGADFTAGNDFSIDNAEGPFTSDTYIEATFNPAGDEDVFAVTNAGAASTDVTLSTFGLAGPGTCDGDTYVHVRDAAGTSLAEADDNLDVGNACAELTYAVPAGETLYFHVLDFGDNDSYPYWALIDFP